MLKIFEILNSIPLEEYHLPHTAATHPSIVPRELTPFTFLDRSGLMSHPIRQALEQRLPEEMWVCIPRPAAPPYLPCTLRITSYRAAVQAMDKRCDAVSQTLGWLDLTPQSHPLCLIRFKPHLWLESFRSRTSDWVFELTPQDPHRVYRFDLRRRLAGEKGDYWTNMRIEWLDPAPPEVEDYV